MINKDQPLTCGKWTSMNYLGEPPKPWTLSTQLGCRSRGGTERRRSEGSGPSRDRRWRQPLSFGRSACDAAAGSAGLGPAPLCLAPRFGSAQ
jgi:hypothetical protein